MNQHRIFKPLSPDQEREILIKDDETFSNTKQYLEPLILSALQRIDEEGRRNKAFQNLITQVPIAARRYLDNRLDSDYRFSTYFTWYIHEEFES